MADDAEAKADPGILPRRIYYKTYCGKDGDKRTHVVHTLKADLLQARGSQHKRCNKEGTKMTDLRKAAEMALKHLDNVSDWDTTYSIGMAKEALRQALAQPVDAVNISTERVDETGKREHEPVASVPEKLDNWVGEENNSCG